MTTLWVKVPVPSLDEQGTAAWLTTHLWWYMSAVAVLSVIIAGARMAWNTRGGQDGRELVRSLLTLSLVSAAALAVVNTALQAGDAYSNWILGVAGGDGFGKRMTVMMAVLTRNQLGVMLVIVVGLVTIVAAIGQVLLMVARSATLVVLAGMWPLSASATNTEWGQRWFKKVSAWIVAFVLYKPAAATIYAAGIQMFGNEKSLLGALMGLTTMVLALLAMPALMRLCVPLVGGLSDGSGGGGGAAAAAAGTVALGASGAARGSGGGGPTGAISVPSLSDGGGTGGGGGRRSGGDQGPSGSTGGSGPSGDGGATAPRGPAGKPDTAPSGGSGGSPAGVGVGGASSAAGGGGGGVAATGASAGSAGAGVGAAVGVGAQAGQAGASGARRVADDSTSEGTS